MLDLVLTNKKGRVGDMMSGGSLDYSVHEKLVFRILHGRSTAVSRIIALDFRAIITLASSRAYLEESHKLGLQKVGWVQKRWLIFK